MTHNTGHSNTHHPLHKHITHNTYSGATPYGTQIHRTLEHRYTQRAKIALMPIISEANSFV